MRHVDHGGIEAQRFALCGDAVDETGGDDVDAGEAAAVEVMKVVQTARCAGASIAQGNDRELRLARDLLHQFDRRHLGVGRLAIALGRDAGLPEMTFEAVDELRAARLADIHQRHRLAVERCRRCETRPAHRRGLGRGIAQSHFAVHGRISLVTAWHSSRTDWPGQPPMMAENSPASPPARTIKSPSGWNLSTIWSAIEGGRPSGTPCAPRTRSRPGRFSAW